MGKLKSMSGEDCDYLLGGQMKLAVASNSMNKMRDYLLVPSDGMNEQLSQEKVYTCDPEDMKKVVKGELENASKMHLAQSKELQDSKKGNGKERRY